MKYIIWRWGLRGPEAALTETKLIDQYDKLNKACDPIEIKPEHLGLSLESLIALYPPPKGERP